MMSEEDLEVVADSIVQLANAITPGDFCRGEDKVGGAVGSLTEAVMGVTSALMEISHSIRDVAEALRERER